MRTNQIGDVIYLQMNEKKPGGVHFDKRLVMSFAGRGVGLSPKPTQSTCPLFRFHSLGQLLPSFYVSLALVRVKGRKYVFSLEAS